ncbi:hypothetical protein B0H12DRAFT_1151687 [Mycena haematopus]|nr:hypothetical protein B0H12DRAFT_1151687 [Mycena haematopus]
MSKLPSLSTVDIDHEGLSVYTLILNAEEAALKKAPKTPGPKYNDNLVGARVLGFLLLDFWRHQSHSFGLIPYKRLLAEISSCLGLGTDKKVHAAIYELGLFYRNHLLRVFRSDGGPVPSVSQDPSRPSMELVRERFIEDIKTPSTKPDARKYALLRDGYRCVLTGAYDLESCDNYPELGARADSEGAIQTTLQCAHIFSESAQEGDKDSFPSALAILKMFGLTDSAESLVGGNVNKPFNTFIMAGHLHYLFDHLKFWLEEVPGMANTYDVCARDPKFFNRVMGAPRRRVTFAVDPDVEAACKAKNKPVPALPSPSLLSIRAACSRVAHMAGAAEQVDQILRDLEQTPVMAEDGTTADLLTSRLLQPSRTVCIGA